MVNEHYVQASYLRLFSPDNESVISRYSLVEKHGGGGYYDPVDRFPVRRAASAESYAEGRLEDDETTRAENAMIRALRGVLNKSELSERDIAHLSQFIVFQRDRSPKAKMFHRLNEEIAKTAGSSIEGQWESVMHLDASERHEAFQDMGWRVVENKTDLPFFTSDVPVVVYQDEFPGGGIDDGFEFTGKEIYCPISPDTLLLLLDPNTFTVSPQHPRIEITRRSVTERREVWKFNLLQGLNSYQEIFGPVGWGNELKELIEVLCSHFPDEEYIRGLRWSTDRILDAQSSGIREAALRPRDDTIPPADKEIITATRKTSHARWMLDHNLTMVEELRRDEPLSEYW